MATLVSGLRLAATLLLPLALLLAIALPVAAAPNAGAGGGGTIRAQLADGTICGTVTDFTPPGAEAGSITINGVTDPVIVGASIDATLSARLDLASSAAPVVACLTLQVNNDGTATAEVTSIVAASGQFQLCGTADVTGTTAAPVFTVGGVTVPTTTLNATLQAYLNAAATVDGRVCLDVTVDAAGMITAAVNLDADLTICGDVVATVAGGGTTYTVAGLAIPAATLTAAEAAALDLAIRNDADACVDLQIRDTVITSATVRVDVCVTVNARSTTNITLDNIQIPLAANAVVAPEARVNAVLGVRVSINATTGAVTVARITLAGCTESGVAGAGAGAGLPNTSVSSAPIEAVGLVGLALLGAGLAVRRQLAARMP